MNKSAANPRSRVRLGLFTTIIVCWVFVCTFPGVYEPLAIGLDESWKYALNALATSHTYFFGRDVAFTYGPLGFVLNPRLVEAGRSLAVAESVLCLLHVLLFSSILWTLRARPGSLLLFCLCYLVICAFGIWLELRVLAVICAVCLLSLEESRDSIVFASLSGLLVSAAPEIKFSVGLGGLTFLAGCWCLLLLRGTRQAIRTVMAGFLFLLLGLVTFRFLFFPSLEDWAAWIVHSAEVASGYSSAMSITGCNGPLLLAFSSTVALALVWFVMPKRPRRSLMLFAPVLFVAFKEAFVRQDGHRFIFFLVAMTVPALLLLTGSLRRNDHLWLTACFVITAIIAVVSAPEVQSFPALRMKAVGSFFAMDPGRRNIGRLFMLREAKEELRVAGLQRLQQEVLPAEWIHRLRETRGTVSIVPNELSIIAANNLSWKPLPTLQLYSTYSAELDQLTATAIRNDGADYLIVNVEGIDGRNPILDSPATWRAVMQQYKVDALDVTSQRILLMRSKLRARADVLHEISKGEAAAEQWVAVPKENHLVYASIRIQYTALGELANLLYQIPALYLDIQRNSGRSGRYRIIPDSSVSGILINYIPDGILDLRDVFDHTGLDSVSRFRVIPSESTHSFNPVYEYRLLASEDVITATSSDSRPPVISEVSPATGSGNNASIEITAASPGGALNLGMVQVLINKDLNGVNGCYLSYEVAQDRLWLISDIGHGAAGFGRFGEATKLANSQCEVLLKRSAATVTTDAVKLRLEIDFKASFSGSRHVYVSAHDRRGLHTKWESRADWEIP